MRPLRITFAVVAGCRPDNLHHTSAIREGGVMMARYAVVVLVPILAVTLAGCGGSTSSASPPVSSPSTSAGSLSATSPSASAPSASGKSPCALSSTSQAAAALGSAVGNAQPKPLAPGTGNGAKGSTCQWVVPHGGSAGYGGSVGIGTLAYPSAAIASNLFKGSTDGVAPGEKLINLPPGLAPGESANVSVLHNVGSSGGTRIAEAVLLAGNRELTIDISEPTSDHFSQAAFVALVKQAAQAWY
jgi:hypothetical protein